MMRIRAVGVAAAALTEAAEAADTAEEEDSAAR